MKRRKPWVAFVLTQICPGLGQLYNGDLRWAAISVAASFAVAFGSEVFLFDTLQKLLWAVVIGLTIDTWLSVQAYIKAKRVGTMELRRYQRWWVYVLFCLAVYGLPDGYGYLIPSRIRSFQIPSESMVPNLLVGDRLVADGWAYWHGEPQRGDIIVFDYPRDPTVKYVKRLVGLPGDKIEMRNNELYLNDKPVPTEVSATPAIEEGSWRGQMLTENLGGVVHTIQKALPASHINFAPVTVPPDHFFMMGDNRDRSSDSRVWGFVSRDALIGRMRYVFFSWDQAAYEEVREHAPHDLGSALFAGVRWARLGLQVH